MGGITPLLIFTWSFFRFFYDLLPWMRLSVYKWRMALFSRVIINIHGQPRDVMFKEYPNVHVQDVKSITILVYFNAISSLTVSNSNLICICDLVTLHTEWKSICCCKNSKSCHNVMCNTNQEFHHFVNKAGCNWDSIQNYCFLGLCRTSRYVNKWQ